jgi:hypothetical protein
LLLLSGRDRFDDAERVEHRKLCCERGLPANGAPKTKKQISSSGTWIDCSKRTRVPFRVSSSAAERARRSRAEFTCCSAREERLDEVARHTLDSTTAVPSWKRQNG